MAGAELAQNMSAMGQELFAPPNVKGWDGEKKWIYSTALAARSAFAERLTQVYSEHDFGPTLDINQVVPGDANDPLKIINLLVERLLDGELPADARRELAQLIVSNDQGMPMMEQFRDDPGFRNGKLRAALGLILSLPEYYTC